MSAWERVLGVDTPAAALPEIARRYANEAIQHLLEQLNADPELTREMRTCALATIAPQIYDSTLDQLTSGWLALQVEAGRVQ